MFNFAKQIWHNSHGTSTVELALIFPIGMALMLGAIDASLGFAEQLRVEAAAARAIEQITAYSRVNVNDNYTASRAEAAAAANVPVSAVTVDNWLECNNVRQSSFVGTCPNNSDQIARFVRVDIRGQFKPVINYGRFLYTDANGFVRVTGDASTRIQ